MNSWEQAGLEIMRRRRSIRVFTPGEVGEEQVRVLLECAMAAPSAAAKDPWRFIVVRERRRLEATAEALPNGKMIAQAALGIVVCGDLEAAHDHQLSYLLQDCSAAIENLLLAATVLGLGACWLGVHPREDRIRKLSDIFALPASVIPVAAVAIGKPGEQKEARTRYNAGFIRQERWG